VCAKTQSIHFILPSFPRPCWSLKALHHHHHHTISGYKPKAVEARRGVEATRVRQRREFRSLASGLS
jgi:hypothetical protein